MSRKIISVNISNVDDSTVPQKTTAHFWKKNLTELQKAIVMSEVLGTPKGRRNFRGTSFRSRQF